MVGVADLIGAAAVVLSREALDALTARAKGEAPEPNGARMATTNIKTRGRMPREDSS